jgi:hypothetical protein
MKFKLSFVIILLLSLFLMSNCKKKEKSTSEPAPQVPSPLPQLSTSAVTSITDSTALSGGAVTSEGTSAITAVGICWDTLPNPTTLRNKTNNGAGTGTYVSKLTGLKINKKYYVRAYATNASGTAYGNEISFLSPVVKPWVKSLSASTYSLSCFLNIGTNIYAGTTNNGVIFSSDTGNTWISKGLVGSSIKNIVKKNTFLFAVGSFGSLSRSSDDGASWVSINSNFPYSVYVSGLGVNGDKLIAGTDSSAFISNDDGNSWTRINNGLPKRQPGFGGGQVGEILSNAQQLFAVAYTFVGPGSAPATYKYDEANNIWNSISYDAPIYDLNFSGNNIIGLGYRFNIFGIPKISKDNGLTWSEISNTSYSNNRVYNNWVLLSGASKFLISSDNGDNFTTIKPLGLPNFSSTYNQTFISANYVWIFISGAGVYKYRYD